MSALADWLTATAALIVPFLLQSWAVAAVGFWVFGYVLGSAKDKTLPALISAIVLGAMSGTAIFLLQIVIGEVV